MCGIFGAYIQSEARSSANTRSLLAALNLLSHRGPDSSGHWFDKSEQLFLGHRRLAIIDLSAAGQQPMSSRSGRYTICFNGEIYNYRALAQEIETLTESNSSDTHRVGHPCGDTATMLAAFELFGVQKALSKFVGMFAFALWDEQLQELTLARDRAGEKPLYYGWKDGKFLFSSELLPLLEYSKSKFLIDPTSLGQLFKFGSVPTPLSIFEEIYKLPAAATLTLSRKALQQRPLDFDPYHNVSGSGPRRYWDLSGFLPRAAATRVLKSEEQYISEFESLLTEAISGQMVSDVPLGAFLSGGIDSSLVVAIMQSLSKTAVKTFCIGFSQKSHDEAPFASAVARHLGCEHNELYVSEQDALDVIPLLPDIYNEPFGDSSQIPTYLVSKMTRQSVTVSLSGDGGDEIFGGYERYLWTNKLWSYLRWLPSVLRPPLAALGESLPGDAIDRLVETSGSFLPQSLQIKNAGAKIKRAISIGTSASAEDLCLMLLSQRCELEKVLPAFQPSKNYLSSPNSWPQSSDLLTRMMWLDFETYLPDDILVKVDRASMAVALESRAPFLDHRVVEFAFGLPTLMKVRGRDSKYLLRRLLAKYVPTTLTDRPKMGFGIPLAQWLSGQLRPWAEDLLSHQALSESGMLNSQAIIQIWKRHLAGDHSNQYFLWHVLMFQAWFRRFKSFIAL